MIDVKRLVGVLQTRRVGTQFQHHADVVSTNDLAWTLAGDAESDGLVVIAEHQSAGRGRFGRKWDSPRGASLLISVVIDSASGALTGAELSLLAAVTTIDAIGDATGVRATVKWPNDLYVGSRKIGGILVEAKRLQREKLVFVLGLGLNCLQQDGHLGGELSATSTSLELESKHAIDRTAVLAAVLTQLDAWLAEPGRWTCDELRTAWIKRSSFIGEPVCLRERGSVFCGTIVDLDPAAAVVVRLDEGGVRAFNAAETTVESIGSMRPAPPDTSSRKPEG